MVHQKIKIASILIIIQAVLATLTLIFGVLIIMFFTLILSTAPRSLMLFLPLILLGLLFVAAIVGLGWYAGLKLYKGELKGWLPGIIVAALSLPNLPIGTALGVIELVLLLDKEAKESLK